MTPAALTTPILQPWKEVDQDTLAVIHTYANRAQERELQHHNASRLPHYTLLWLSQCCVGDQQAPVPHRGTHSVHHLPVGTAQAGAMLWFTQLTWPTFNGYQLPPAHLEGQCALPSITVDFPG
jgi:hypothetical protein